MALNRVLLKCNYLDKTKVNKSSTLPTIFKMQFKSILFTTAFLAAPNWAESVPSWACGSGWLSNGVLVKGGSPVSFHQQCETWQNIDCVSVT